MKLVDICEINPKAVTLEDNTLVSFVAMPDVSENGKIKVDTFRPYGEVKKGFTCFKEGDVLFAKITPCMENGKGALAIGLKNGFGCGSTEFHVLRPKENMVIRKWLYYLTTWSAFRVDAERHMTGSAGQKRVPKTFLEKYELEVPSLKIQEQQVIQLDRLRKIIDLRKQQLSALDDLIKARFVEMFGDPVKNPKGWEITTIGDITTDVRYGTSKPAIENGKYPYLRMNNLTFDGHLDLSDLKYIDVDDDELEKCVVRKGDVLFNRTNSIELVGKTAAFDLDEEMIIAGYIIRVRLGDCMLPDILAQYMNLEALKEKLRKMAKGAVNQANINAQELQSIKIYLPDMNSQKQFVNFKKQTDKSKLAIQKSLEKTQLLFDSLMQEYFG